MSKQFKRIAMIAAVLTAAVVMLSALSQTGTHNDTQATKSAVELTAESVRWLIEWLRIIGGLVAIVVGAGGVIAYYRVSIRTKEIEALKSAVDSYHLRIVSQDDEIKLLKESKAGLVARMIEKDDTLKKLQDRTDMTPIVQMLTSLIKAQDERYKEAMSILRVLQPSADPRK